MFDKNKIKKWSIWYLKLTLLTIIGILWCSTIGCLLGWPLIVMNITENLYYLFAYFSLIIIIPIFAIFSSYILRLCENIIDYDFGN